MYVNKIIDKILVGWYIKYKIKCVTENEICFMKSLKMGLVK